MQNVVRATMFRRILVGLGRQLEHHAMTGITGPCSIDIGFDTTPSRCGPDTNA
jgi:hypothetical protein